jgi:hypothetical protein
MDSGLPKVRRRYTGVYRKAEVDVSIKGEDYPSFLDWFNIYCQQGVLPTMMMTPYGAEEAWRFTEPPAYQWIQSNVVKISAKIERFPGWP